MAEEVQHRDLVTSTAEEQHIHSHYKDSDDTSVATSGIGESLHSSDTSSREILVVPQSISQSVVAKNSIMPQSGGAGSFSQSWLLRLFESKLFDASMAMAYLFQSKEPGVLVYIGNKLFSYTDEDIDFYMPQMANMYLAQHEIAEVLHPYIVHRCRQSVDFSLTFALMLDAYGADASVLQKKRLVDCVSCVSTVAFGLVEVQCCCLSGTKCRLSP